MRKIVLLLAGVLAAQWANCQEYSGRRHYLALGLTRMGSFYIDTNESVYGVGVAPAFTASFALAPLTDFQAGVAYRRVHSNRDEAVGNFRFVEQKEVRAVIVPMYLRFTLGRGSLGRRTQAGLLTGIVWRYTDTQAQQASYDYTLSANPRRKTIDDQRLDTFLSVGGALRYNATTRWAVLADATLNLRLAGGRTMYYEYMPTGMLQVGVGYCLQSKYL
jgi:hypothetical protein